MSRTVSIEIDPADHPSLQRMIESRAGELSAENEPDDPYETFDGEIANLQDGLETIRRLLTSPQPSPSEAMIYVERALITLAGMK